MKPFRLNRRALLRGLGVGIALPTLDAMLDNRGLLHGVAYGQSMPAPVRLITFYFPVGTHMNNWKPHTAGTSWGITPALAPLQTPIAPLPAGLVADIRPDVNVLTGLGNAAARVQPLDPSTGMTRGGDHARGTSTFATGVPCTLSGAGGPSVDQVAAQHLGMSTRFRSLPIAVDAATTGSDSLTSAHLANLSWSAANTPVPADRDPRTLFNRLFAGSTDTAGAARLAADRRSVLDSVTADLNRLNQRIGANDRARVQEHLDSIRQLETQVTAVAAACTAPAQPMTSYPAANTRARVLIDLLVLALKCDLTRFASFQLANGGNNTPWPWTGVTLGPHTVSHTVYADPTTHAYYDSQYTDFNHITAYAVDTFGYLVRQLKAQTEGGATMLDNSLVFMSSEISEGSTHSHYDMPVLLAGKGGGRVVTGRHIVYPDHTPMNNLFVAMLNFAGYTTSSFGMDGTQILPNLTG